MEDRILHPRIPDLVPASGSRRFPDLRRVCNRMGTDDRVLRSCRFLRGFGNRRSSFPDLLRDSG